MHRPSNMCENLFLTALFASLFLDASKSYLLGVETLRAGVAMEAAIDRAGPNKVCRISFARS